jgi:hypothetical protein
MAIKEWMAWEGGVDVAGFTASGLQLPNLIVHVARSVHTPAGTAQAGMIFWQPDPSSAPVVAGFVCPDSMVGAYFGPKIFAGTPFEKLPALGARIEVRTQLPISVSARIEVAGHVFEVLLGELGESELVQRAAGSPLPFAQQGVEARAARASVKIDGKHVALTLPPFGPSGGPAAVWSPAGIYAR